MTRFSPFDHVPALTPLSAHQWVSFGMRENNPATGQLLSMAETGCLDAPLFSPAGSTFCWKPAPVECCATYSARPFDYKPQDYV